MTVLQKYTFPSLITNGFGFLTPFVIYRLLNSGVRLKKIDSSLRSE
jgi:hypothetical protein